MKRPSYKTTLVTLSVLSFFMLSTPLSKADEDVVMPARAQDTGKLGRIDFKTSLVVISDVIFGISPNMRAYALNGRPIPLSALKPGTIVAFRLAPTSVEGGYSKIIEELWVMPSETQ